MSRVRAPRVPSPMGSRGSKHGCRPRWVQDLPVLPLPRTSNASHGMRSLTYRPVELPLFVHGQVEAGVHRPDGHNADTHRPDLDDACGAGKRCCEMGHLLQGPFPRCPQGVTTQGQHRRPQKVPPRNLTRCRNWGDGQMDGWMDAVPMEGRWGARVVCSRENPIIQEGLPFIPILPCAQLPLGAELCWNEAKLQLRVPGTNCQPLPPARFMVVLPESAADPLPNTCCEAPGIQLGS